MGSTRKGNRSNRAAATSWGTTEVEVHMHSIMKIVSESVQSALEQDDHPIEKVCGLLPAREIPLWDAVHDAAAQSRVLVEIRETHPKAHRVEIKYRPDLRGFLISIWFNPPLI